MDIKKLEELTGKFCDDYCKYPCEIKDVDQLEKVCSECPMNEMFDLLPAPPKTKFDIIKNMDIEQMAEFIYSAPDKICFESCVSSTGDQFKCKYGNDIKTENCIECMKKYLINKV